MFNFSTVSNVSVEVVNKIALKKKEKKKGIFGKIKEQIGTRHFLKERVVKKANKYPWL